MRVAARRVEVYTYTIQYSRDQPQYRMPPAVSEVLRPTHDLTPGHDALSRIDSTMLRSRMPPATAIGGTVHYAEQATGQDTAFTAVAYVQRNSADSSQTIPVGHPAVKVQRRLVYFLVYSASPLQDSCILICRSPWLIPWALSRQAAE